MPVGGPKSVVGSWTHVREHDVEGGMSFRPSDGDVPLSREPRRSIELAPDGTMRLGTPGADDRRVWADGGWRLEGDELVLSPAGGGEQRYRVESADEQHLLLRPIQQ